MSAARNIALAIVSIQSAEPLRQKKLLSSYLEGVNYIYKKFDNDQTIVELNSAIWRYTKPVSITPMQYADKLYANSCQAADVYNESTLNDLFTESIETFICHSFRKYQAFNLQAALTDIALNRSRY